MSHAIYPISLWLTLELLIAGVPYQRTEVTYHRAPDYKGDTIDLIADLYLPEHNGEALCPVLVLVHGGGFESGNRRDKPLVYLAERYAAQGFFVASIEYRLGLPESWQAQDWIEANVRAVQDLRTFVRYLKAQAANGNPYHIDTTKIIAYGWSAGAFTVLQAAFLTSLEELAMVSEADTARIRQIGGLYGAGYADYTSDFWMAISSSGAVYRLEWVSPNKISHLVCIHPLADSVVKPDVQVGHRAIIWYGGVATDSVFKARGGSSFLLTMDAPYCHMPGISCHSWEGDAHHVSFGAPIVERYLMAVIAPLLRGENPPDELRYHFAKIDRVGLARGCAHRLLGLTPIRGECKTLAAEIFPDKWAWAVLIAIGLYFLTQVFIAGLIHRTKVPATPRPAYQPQILIPFRNEASVIGSLIDRLKTQTIRLRLTFGDDGSGDESREIIAAHTRDYPEVEVHTIPADWHKKYPGKQAVLAYLEQSVSTDVFFVADADMRFPARWAETLYGVLMRDDRLGGACGPSLPRESTLWEAFQRVEHASILYLIAANQRLGHIPTAIGNSLILRRRAWEQVGGWRALPPTLVEDYELLRALERASWRFQWVFHPDALGETRAERSFRGWLQQRLRWRYAAQNLPTFAIAYWGFQSLLPWMILMSGGALTGICAGSLWILAEALPLWRFRRVVGARRILRYLPLLLMYRAVQGPWLLWLGFTRAPVQWRGRQYDPK